MSQLELRSRLASFAASQSFLGKGPLCVALVVTRTARDTGLPLNPATLLTDQGGQVKGLGKSGVQRILADHGITRVLAQEGARTSRGSISNMRTYVQWLNDQVLKGPVDLAFVETFWVEAVQKFFAAKPFKLRFDTAKSTRDTVRDLLDQASTRQSQGSGTTYTGAVLQHLVGAKLECVVGADRITHHSYSTSDDQTGRAGDFLLDDVAIHVTTFPGEAVLKRCQENLDHGLRPVVVTIAKRIAALQQTADALQLGDRIDFYDIEQFISLNLFEFAKFEAKNRKLVLHDLIDRYNALIDLHETDPSLKIEVA